MLRSFNFVQNYFCLVSWRTFNIVEIFNWRPKVYNIFKLSYRRRILTDVRKMFDLYFLKVNNLIYVTKLQDVSITCNIILWEIQFFYLTYFFVVADVSPKFEFNGGQENTNYYFR